MEPTSENNTRDMLINPYYAVVFDDLLFTGHKQEIAKEDWVLKNSKLIDADGAEKWLTQLLEQLQAKPAKDSLNLGLVVQFSEDLRGDHELPVTPEMWVQANAKMVKELGSNEYLWRLLDVLESGNSSN